MRIVMRYTSTLVSFTGKRRETFDVSEGTTIRQAIHVLAEVYDDRLLKLFYDDAQAFEPQFTIALNGRVTQMFDEPLAQDDEIALVAQFAGG